MGSMCDLRRSSMAPSPVSTTRNVPTAQTISRGDAAHRARDRASDDESRRRCQNNPEIIMIPARDSALSYFFTTGRLRNFSYSL
jgi:hypothetical protein